MAAITIANMTKSYGDNTVVDDMQLEIRNGEFFTFLGPSGCGKTTTLRCIAGLEEPDSGRIGIGDETVYGGRGGAWVPPEKRNAGMVFQSYALWPHMSVVGNVAYPLRRRGVRRDEARRKARDALELVSLSGMADRAVNALSGGQQQRVALARALVAEPRMVLFDEPLSNLDAKLRGEMRDQIGTIARTVGTTSVYVTHDQTEALTLSDRIAVMSDGRVQQVGTPEEIYSHPRTPFVADFVGFDNLLTGRLVEVSGRTGVVEVPGLGRLQMRDLPPAAGQRVMVAVRASDVSVADARGRGPNTFAARVEGSVYLGEHVDLRLRAGSHVVKARASAASLRHLRELHSETEQDVSVSISPDAVAVMAISDDEQTRNSA